MTPPDSSTYGPIMHGWMRDLFKIPRSLSGPGVRATLSYVQSQIPELQIHEIATGSKVFDWEVPNEWTLRKAYIEDEAGARVVDVADHGLHIVGYSQPVDTWLDLSELQSHLYSLPENPDAIPYVTSYYSARWGFCLSERQRALLKPGRYHVVIDADHKPGVINYADFVLPGSDTREIMFSTYVCHPEMANNELSGPVVAMALADWLKKQDRRFTYRFVFVPETIGAIIYLSRNLDALRASLHAGFVLTCIGDERTYSFMPSRKGKTMADRVARHALANFVDSYKAYSFLERGSDERQYCSPGVDLPVASIMRSKYGTFPEYHTSLDNMNLVTPAGLQGGFDIMRQCIEILERNVFYTNTTFCEPQLGKRGLYPTLSKTGSADQVRNMMNVLAYADGTLDLIDMAEEIRIDALQCAEIAEKLEAHGLLRASNDGTA